MELYTEIALITSLVETGEHNNPISVYQLDDLKKLLVDLEEKARDKSNRLSGYRNVGRGFRAVIRSGNKTMDKRFYGATVIDGITYVCDGHRAMRTAAPIELKISEEPFGDCDKLFGLCHALNSDEEIQLPEYADLLNQVKTTRRRVGKKPTLAYVFKEGLTLNADYLLDAMMSTNATKLTRVPGSVKDIVALKGNDVEAIILPIVNREKDTPGRGLFVLP